MSEALTLEELDRDGAIQESVAELAGDTRAGFMRKAAIGGGAIMGSGVILGAIAPMAGAAPVPKSDVAILNFALTLEYLEAEFYTQAEKNLTDSGELMNFAKVVGRHERAHVAFLKKALGSAAVKKPRFDFKDTTSDLKKFVATAQVLEDTGVSAYLGQAGKIKNKAVLGAAASILAVEARHAAWIRHIRGDGGSPIPAPAAFDAAKSKAQILAAVTGTGFIVG